MKSLRALQLKQIHECEKPELRRLGTQPLPPLEIGLDLYFPLLVHIFIEAHSRKKAKTKPIFNAFQLHPKLCQSGFFGLHLIFTSHSWGSLSLPSICIRDEDANLPGVVFLLSVWVRIRIQIGLNVTLVISLRILAAFAFLLGFLRIWRKGSWWL